MEIITQYLPPGPGYLPRWLLFVGTLAAWNSIHNYINTGLTQRIYTGKPALATPLQARTFGTWTLLSSIVRVYCAYNISNKQVYDITIWTYIIVLFNFNLELYVFKTVKVGPGVLSPLIVSSLSLLWMAMQYKAYVG